MWFVLMIIGIYMCIPIIKPIVETNVKIKYYLLLSFVFAFVVPEVTVLTNDFGNELIVKFVNTINNDVNTMRMYFVHVFVLEQLYVRFGLNALSYNPVFAVIYIGVLVFVISFALSAILNRIPVVKKYVV